MTRTPVRSTEQRVLALLLAVAAVLAAVSAAVPMSPQAPVRLHAASAAVAVVVAALVLALPHPAVRHGACAAVVAGFATSTWAAATDVGAAAAGVLAVWVPLYSAFFFGRRTTRAYVAGTAAALGAAYALDPFPGAAHVWAVVVLTTAVATEAVGGLVGRLEAQATTDPLTGALNREGLRQAAQRLLADATPSSPLTAVVIDLDGFKAVNDELGHAAGDALLAGSVAAWRALLRRDDVLARLGGDEFVLLLPGTERRAAVRLARRLQEASTTSWSSGVATAVRPQSLAQLLEAADADLYALKARRTAGLAGLPHQRTGGPLRVLPRLDVTG
jgi:diguanylate cyclase (GGDEF)-like protein